MVRLSCEAMRTRFEIVLADDADPVRLRAAGEEALAEIARVEALLSVYRPESELTHLNNHAADAPLTADPRVFALLRRARTLSEITSGAFDMTVGPLLRCWGFTREDPSAVPSDGEIVRARALVGMADNVVLDEAAGSVYFAQQGVRLDPGAIGKGYALERAADLLRQAGVASALLHGGTSTVCALDAPPGEPGWRIAVQDPTRADAHLATVLLRDNALSVSAVHGKSFRANGRRFGHVVDPRMGRPVANALLAAVVAPSPTDTDALSTGLLILGAAGLARIGDRCPAVSLLLAREGRDGKESGAPLVNTKGNLFAIHEDRTH